MTVGDEEILNLITTDYDGLNVNTIGEGEPIFFLHGGPGCEHRFFSPMFYH